MFPETPDKDYAQVEPENEVFLTEVEEVELAITNVHPSRSIIYKVKVSEGGNAVVRIRPVGGVLEPATRIRVRLELTKGRRHANRAYRLLVQHLLAPSRSGDARVYWRQASAQNIAPKSRRLDLVLRE